MHANGIDIDDLPEEYTQYKEQIIVLRQFEKMRVSNAVINRMKKSVGVHVLDNEDVRIELSQLEKAIEEARKINN